MIFWYVFLMDLLYGICSGYLSQRFLPLLSIDNSYGRLNFDPGNLNKIFHYSWKDHGPAKFANFVQGV